VRTQPFAYYTSGVSPIAPQPGADGAARHPYLESQFAAMQVFLQILKRGARENSLCPFALFISH